ncbi:hypothetical protein [Anaerovorax odorimutans]|uniref:hypothetical protein n=1 Tax=Anaerovorax odorimutans TaxID=109327 RepID=UPI00041C547A|nr:hypothetical protein [Anaerovorax odorimutans]
MLIKTISRTFSEEQIVGMLNTRDENIRIEKVDKLYYPYAMMIYSVKLKKGMMSKFNRQMMCNIDLVCARPAIGKGKPTFKEIEIDEVMAVPPQVDKDDLDGIGHDYVVRIFIGKMKILQTPIVSVDSIDYFHKLFYIVHCKDDEDKDYFIMADSMDGNISILEC